MPRATLYIVFVLAISTIGGCSSDSRTGGAYEAMSLLGKPLRAPELSLDVMQDRSQLTLEILR